MNSERSALSRSKLLTTIAFAPIAMLALARTVAEAAATPEGHLAQNAVQYQSTPKDGHQCSTCKYYINAKSKTANGGCTQVAGSISPKAWCLIYAKGDNSKQTL